MKLYVASSWRNPHQPEIVRNLRVQGHEVYDFRHPPGGDHLGFSWSDIDPDWPSWSADQYVAALGHPIAAAGFESDFEAMRWADAGVLVLPCGRSAHLEAGYFVGAGKLLYILLDPAEFRPDAGHHVTELMYRMATAIFTDSAALLAEMYLGSPMQAAMQRLDAWAGARQLTAELDMIDEVSPAQDHEVVAEWTRGLVPS